MYFYQLDCYERAIREPVQQQEKTIIYCYVHLCLELAKQCNTKPEANRIYRRMTNTFEEILCDDLIPQAWRQVCFKAFKQVKPILFEIMSDTQYQRLSSRFNQLADYFLKKDNTNKSADISRNNSSPKSQP